MASNAFYEFRNWHAEPDCRVLAVPTRLGVGIMLVCVACGCASELEATGGRSTQLEAAKTRTTLAASETGDPQGMQIGLGPL